MNKLQKLGWFMCGSIFWACAAAGIDVAIFRGDHIQQRLERQVVVDGKKKWEVIYPTDDVFSDMQCMHKYDAQRAQKYVNKCMKAGVPVDD